jgi:hypothetical protein
VTRKRAPDFDALPEVLPDEVVEAMDTPVARDCWAALKGVADKHGLVACDEGGECYFPRCLADGCEAEPRDPKGAL